MPSDAENINYLYLVLTNDGPPTVSHTTSFLEGLKLRRISPSLADLALYLTRVHMLSQDRSIGTLYPPRST
jgi:hypothetical protein